jgi:hypothetical protein
LLDQSQLDSNGEDFDWKSESLTETSIEIESPQCHSPCSISSVSSPIADSDEVCFGLVLFVVLYRHAGCFESLLKG